jgi:hypothetical protein
MAAPEVFEPQKACDPLQQQLLLLRADGFLVDSVPLVWFLHFHRWSFGFPEHYSISTAWDSAAKE